MTDEWDDLTRHSDDVLMKKLDDLYDLITNSELKKIVNMIVGIELELEGRCNK